MTTATPLPQTAPQNPTTSLDAARLGRILRGEVDILEDGVVPVHIRRREQFTLGACPSVQCWAFPTKFALLPEEIALTMRLMRREGFDVHCLYNRETAENPQLSSRTFSGWAIPTITRASSAACCSRRIQPSSSDQLRF